MKKAWVENGFVRDVCHGNPSELYQSDIAALYDTNVPDDVVSGATLEGGAWTNPPPPEPVATIADSPILSPVAFKMCFTAQERIALKALRAADPVVDDWMGLLDDPRLSGVDLGLRSTQDAVDYLVGKVDGFTVERAAQVKSGLLK